MGLVLITLKVTNFLNLSVQVQHKEKKKAELPIST